MSILDFLKGKRDVHVHGNGNECFVLSEVRILTGINKTDRNVHCWLVIIFTWLTLIAADRWKILNNYSSQSHSHSFPCNKMDLVHAMLSHAVIMCDDVNGLKPSSSDSDTSVAKLVNV